MNASPLNVRPNGARLVGIRPYATKATAARERLAANPDPKAPTTMDDLVSVAVERLLLTSPASSIVSAHRV